jgi:hypothetical protein
MRIVFSFAFILACVILPAQNNLRLFDPDGDVFTVYLGDSICNKVPQTEVLLTGLKKDSLELKIQFANGNVDEFVYLLERGRKVSGKEFVYKVSIKKSKPKITFIGNESMILMPANIVPNKPAVDTSKKYNNKVLEHYVDLKNSNITYFNNYPYDGKCQLPMPASYLNYMGILMKKAQTDDDIFLIAQNTTQNNCLSVDQLNVILGYISYEIEKLKLIRSAYFSLVDVNNRDKLNLSFKLEASKKQLADFFKNSEQYRYKSGKDCTTAASKEEMDEFTNALVANTSDVEKLILLRKTYLDHCFDIEQSKIILGKFIHDRERLDAAKLLYFHCIEKERFTEVKETFSYTTTIADLEDFIKKQ